MALEPAGVKLIADGADAFARDLAGAKKAVADFSTATERGGKSVGGFGQVAIGMARRAGGALVDFGIKAVGAVTDFAGASLQTAEDYEQSMNVLQAQSSATDDEMNKVRETAKALGADLSLPSVSAATAGQAMLELSKGGLSVQESMAAAKGTLMLAAAAQTDVATAANITTGALKAFGLAGDRAGYVADLLANSANQSRASITDLAQGFQQAAFRFRSAGQGADDLAASLAILTNNGLTGSDAGTALQNAFARLQAPTDKAAKLMHELGINVYDANGNMLPMRDIIGVLNDRLGGMTQEQRNAALSTVFLSDGMKAMIPLMASGVDGYDTMKAAVNRVGSAQALAAAQMKGLKGAAEGLQSQLETLALEALEPLLPLFAKGLRGAAAFAGGFVGKVGPAVKDVIAFVTDAGDVFQTLFIPALSAATAAMIAYGVSALAPALVNLNAMSAVLLYQTGLWIKNAASVALAAAPYAAIALAIGGVVLAYQNLKSKITDASTALLDSRQWWKDSTAALTAYDAASDATKEKVSAHAATIRELRSEIQSEIESLGMRMAAGDVTEQQYAKEMAAINAKRAGLIQVTAAMDKEMDGMVRAQAAQTTATQATNEFANAQANAQAQTKLTVEELDTLAKAFTKIMADGAAAGAQYVTTSAALNEQLIQNQDTHNANMQKLYAELESAKTKEQADGIRERIKQEEDGFAESTKNALKAYAEQASAQKQALGEQLLAYTENQREMGNLTDEKAAAMRETIVTQFGIARDSTALLFGQMASSIDGFAKDAGTSTADVIKDWDNATKSAVELKQKADALKDKYTMEIIADFQQGRITLDEAKRKLEEIPKRVESEIVITETHVKKYVSGEGDHTEGGGYSGTKASGGPVKRMTTYLVGEQGRELFVPEQDGYIINASDTRQLLQALAQPSYRAAPATAPVMMAAPQTTYNNQRTYTMPIYTNQSPAVVQQSFALSQAVIG